MISDMQQNFDFAIGLNNRQVISRLKIQNYGLNKIVSNSLNSEIIALQIELLERASLLSAYPDEVVLNLCLHQWWLGNLLDDELCTQIIRKL